MEQKGKERGKVRGQLLFYTGFITLFIDDKDFKGACSVSFFYTKREYMDIEKNKKKELDTKAESSDMQVQDAEENSVNDDTIEQLNQCKVTLAEWQEKYARLTADLENYKKRTIKERSAWAESAQEKILSQLLSIVDNFDRAMELKPEVPQELQAWVDGISMIYSSFGTFLKNAGVKEVSYDTFNPEFHEALMQVDSDEKESGEIIEVMEKGYMLNDRVLRPAKVSVAK